MQEIKVWLNSNQDFQQGSDLYNRYGSNSFLKEILLKGSTPYLKEKLEAELKVLASSLPAWPVHNHQDYIAKHILSPVDFYKEVMHNPVPDDTLPGTSNGRKLDCILVDEARDLPYLSKGKRSIRSKSNIILDNVFYPVPELPEIKVSDISAKEFARYLSLKELNKKTYRQLEHNMTALSMSTDSSFLHLTAKQILSLHDKITDIYKLLDHYDDHGSFPVIKINEEIIRTPAEEIQLLWVSNWKANRRLNSGKCRDLEKTKALILWNDKRIAELVGKGSK